MLSIIWRLLVLCPMENIKCWFRFVFLKQAIDWVGFGPQVQVDFQRPVVQMSIQFPKPLQCCLCLPCCVPSSDQYTTWAVLHIVGQFSKPVVCMHVKVQGMPRSWYTTLWCYFPCWLPLKHNLLGIFQLWGSPFLVFRLESWGYYLPCCVLFATDSQVKWWEDWDGERKPWDFLPCFWLRVLGVCFTNTAVISALGTAITAPAATMVLP